MDYLWRSLKIGTGIRSCPAKEVKLMSPAELTQVTLFRNGKFPKMN